MLHIAYEKLFIRRLIQNQFTLDWSTAKPEAKRMHGGVGLIKCLKYNLYNQMIKINQNIWTNLLVKIRIKAFFVFGSEKINFGL